MRIAIISDIHDNVWKLDAALAKIREEQPDALICCGDLCSPFVVGLMAGENGFPGPIHVVFGNNDTDLYRITQQAVPGRVMFYGEFAEFVVQDERLRPRQEFIDKEVDHFFDRSIQGKRIAVNHFPYLARPIAASEKYDIVFYGHNHKYRHERLGQVDVINPGTIMGFVPTAKKGEDKYVDATFLHLRYCGRG